MKHDSTTCSDDRLRSLLQCDEDSDESRLSALHVDHCPRCQLRLEELAAEPAEWRIVKHSLVHDNDENGPNHNVPSERPWVRARWQRHPTAWTDSMARQLLSPPSHPEMLGRIGRYEVERLIGVGGMGGVFKAFDTELNRPVAVKVLAPYLAGSGAARKRFAREARAAAAVVHEHVVAIHNVETDGESPFLVMPYVAGESLQQRIDRDGALELCEILRIAMQTASGLAAAHAQGLVHRDVKPSNILLEQGIERTLLTDFGLARASDDASLTHTGYHPGTPQYMSPEQARGDAVDARSDLFSLGSVIYTMCTGRPPFRAETNYGVLRRITDNEPRRIREVNPAIPEWLDGIVNKLLSKDVSQRFQSANEVAELLEQCLAHVQQPTAVALPTSLRCEWHAQDLFSFASHGLKWWISMVGLFRAVTESDSVDRRELPRRFLFLWSGKPYRLALLLAGLAILLVFASWGGRRDSELFRLRQGVAWAASLGGKGKVVDDGWIFENHGLHLDLERSRVEDEDLRTVGALADVHRLDLDGTAVTDDGLKYLQNCRGLKYLDLFGTRVSESAVHGFVESMKVPPQVRLPNGRFFDELNLIPSAANRLSSSAASQSQSSQWDNSATDIDSFAQDLAPFESRSQQLWDNVPTIEKE